MGNDFKVIDVDLGYRRLSKTLAEVGETSSKAGLIRGTSKDVLERGAKNQFGGIASEGGQIPPRPFITQAWDAGAVDEYATLIIGSLEEYIETGDLSAVARGYEITASIAAQDIQDTIRRGDFVELSPQTIERKGNEKILRESDELLNSIDSELVEQKGPFKPADTDVSISKSVLGYGKTGSRRAKRPRKVGFRRKLKSGGLAALAKSPGYQGRGIRKRADKRPNAAEGVLSQGTRRRGLRF